MEEEGDLCPCGQPLHYSDPVIRAKVEAMIADKGETQPVTVAGQGTWRVPRHYIALHGFKGWELPGLAGQYGWEKVQ